jgi:hypothetical protein
MSWYVVAAFVIAILVVTGIAIATVNAIRDAWEDWREW